MLRTVIGQATASILLYRWVNLCNPNHSNLSDTQTAISPTLTPWPGTQETLPKGYHEILLFRSTQDGLPRKEPSRTTAGLCIGRYSCEMKTTIRLRCRFCRSLIEVAVVFLLPKGMHRTVHLGAASILLWAWLRRATSLLKSRFKLSALSWRCSP